MLTSFSSKFAKIDDSEQAHKLLETLIQKPEMVIRLHRELVRSPAINPEHGGEGEELKARWISDRLYENGLCRVERWDSLDDRVPLKLRPNLVAHFKPAGTTQTLWIVTHMDVADSGPREHWTSDPFVLRVDGDRLYGRGVEDNNQAIVSALLLFDAIKESNCPVPMGLGLICTCAGITDYRRGIGHILKRQPNLFKPHDLIVIPDYGSPDGSVIEIGEKRNAWLQISVYGKEYHAGFGTGVNAFEAGALFISRLGPVRERVACPNPLFILPATTITPTLSDTTCTGVNHVPAKFVFYLDLRLTPGCPLESVMIELQKLAEEIEELENVTFAFQIVELTPDGPVTPQDAPVIRALSKAIKKKLGKEARCIGVGGVTMASSIRSLGFPAAVWSIQKSGKNKVDEYISIEAQIAQTRVLASILFSRERKIRRKILHTVEQKAHRITQAESEVGRLVGLGFNNEAICRELGITENTARTHLKSLYRKTEAMNRQALARLFSTIRDENGSDEHLHHETTSPSG